MRKSNTAQTFVAVIEDDASVRRSLCRFLRASGMHPTPYVSAEAFLADNQRSRFDCLVVDVQLGGMSGLDLNRHLAASGSTIPVIFNTAFDTPEIREQAFQAGAFAFVKKTDVGETLLTAIAEALRSAPKVTPPEVE
jgi:FixJ family two-component response regulator